MKHSCPYFSTCKHRNSKSLKCMDHSYSKAKCDIYHAKKRGC